MIKLYKIKESPAYGLRNDDHYIMVDGKHVYNDLETLCSFIRTNKISKGIKNQEFLQWKMEDIAEYNSIDDFKSKHAEYFI